ncbi:hypothetical protein OGM63_09655 [Plectonema radiosum NIES-515]|uniref:Uncharacterized protein n=1 Tax=Plectonema radiosum NIES-515 TaxID=2986073 RepID=A0ABT3AXF2_9CYAN|nr:hypothetical protein [Plectonema radiosum]MCV3213770.1 hypothetical protein [Plectonema radiosum NIES-515]
MQLNKLWLPERLQDNHQVYEALGDGDGQKRAYSRPPVTNFSRVRSTVETFMRKVEAIALSE